MDSSNWHELDEALKELCIDISSKAFAATKRDGTPIRKLFIGNLAERSTTKDLEQLFSKYGKVESCCIKHNMHKSNFAFLTFEDVESGIKARKAATAMRLLLHYRVLRVSAADSWHQPDSIENRKNLLLKANSTSLCIESADRSLINILNNDCLMEVFLYLPLADRVRMERVCKRWRAVVKDSWRSVKKLDLSNATWGLSRRIRLQTIDTDTLRKILKRCGQYLTHLSLSDRPNSLSSSTLTIVAKFCPNLQHVNVTALELSPSGIYSLLIRCKNINTFIMRTLSGSCEKELALLFEENQKLRRFSIEGDQHITGKCLLDLPEDMEEINLSSCPNIVSVTLDTALAKFTKLKSFVLNSCVCANKYSLQAISRKVSLTHLDLGGRMPMISAADMDVLCELVNLQTLQLKENTAVTDGFLIKVSKSCRKLTSIDVSSCEHVSDQGIMSLGSLPELQTLNMCSLYDVTDEALKDLVGLHVLSCESCVNIGDVGIISLVTNSPNLRYLDLSGCSITNLSLEAAVIATIQRKNNVVLKMIVSPKYVNVSELDISPLLHIVRRELPNLYELF